MDYNSIQASVLKIAAQPTAYFSRQLQTAVKYTDSGIRNALFGDTPQAVFPHLDALAGLKARGEAAKTDLSRFALTYVSYVVSTNTTRGFNKTIQQVSFNDVSGWITQHSGGAVGTAMFLDFLAAPDKLAAAFADAGAMQQSAQAIHDNLGSQAAFDMLIAQLQHGTASASVFPAKVFLLLLHILDNGGARYTSLAQAWQQSTYWNLVSDWETISWLDTLSGDFVQNAAGYNTVFQAVSAACNTASNVATNYKHVQVINYWTGYPAENDVETGTTTTYGTPLLNWLNSDNGPKTLGFRSGNGPDNMVTTPKSSSGCLLAGTRVLTEGGAWIPVEDVRPGDRLLDGRQEVIVASADCLVNPRVDAVYGINDDAPMMSMEHAVMTQRGWCSLDPDHSMRLNPHIRVGLLSLGDVVWRMRTGPNGEREIAFEEVRDIPHRELKPGAEGTGIAIRFEQGGRSVWANGYCTLANFPELHAGTIAGNLKRHGSAKDQQALLDGLREASPLFEKVLGKSTLEGVMEALKAVDDHADPGFVPPHRDLGNLVAPRLIPSFKEGSAPVTDLAHLAVINGQLLINGQPVPTHTDRDHLYWTRQNTDGTAEHGALRFSSERTSAHGMIAVGDNQTAVSAYSQMEYNTVYGEANTAWYTFEMGFKENEDGSKTQFGQLVDDQGQVIPDDHARISFGSFLNPDKQLLVTADIEFNPTWVAWTKSPWIAATITMNNDFRSFTGALYTYDKTQPGNRGQGFPMHGIYAPHAALQMDQKALTAQYLARAASPESLDTSGAPRQAHPMFATAMALRTDDHQSVEALYSLSPPDLVELHQANFATLKNLMLYSVPDDLLPWFNLTRPAVGPGQSLNQQEADLTKNAQIRHFLNDRFAMGYLSQAFSAAKDTEIRKFYEGVPDWKDRLAYFWQGHSDGCFASDKGYNQAALQIMDANYRNTVPGLASYMDDGKSWAAKLYHYCMKPDILSSLASIDPQTGSMQYLNNTVMKLNALDPGKAMPDGKDRQLSYGSALYRAVLNCKLEQIRSGFASGSSSSDETKDLMNAFLRKYFEMAENGNPDWGSDTQAAARQNLEDAKKEYGVDTIDALEEHWVDIVASMADIIEAAGDLPLTQRIADWADRNPVKAKLFGVGVSFAVFGFAAFNLIQTAINWKDMPAAEKAKAIADVASGMASLFNEFAQFKNAQILTGMEEGDRLFAAVDIDLAVGDIELMPLTGNVAEIAAPVEALEMDDWVLLAVGRSGAGAIAAAGSLEESASMWTKVAKVSGKVAEGMGILAMGVACWATGQQIKDDIDSGQSPAVIALDILEEVANAACFVIAAGIGLAGLLSVQVASFIPVIGAVVAIIGILISIILLLLHRNPPETPAESFVETYIVPWLQKLATPPAEWLQNREKAQEHLNGSAVLAV